MRPLIALSVMLLPALTTLAALMAPSAAAAPAGTGQAGSQCPPGPPWLGPCGQARSHPRSAYSSRSDGVTGVSTVPGGPATCGPADGSVRVWVPMPCPVRPGHPPAATPRRSPAPRATRPARPGRTRTQVPVTAPVPAAAVPAATQEVTVRPRVTPPGPRIRPAGFRPVPALPPEPAYTPGRPVLPVGVLITVVLAPCVITVAARLGKLLARG